METGACINAALDIAYIIMMRFCQLESGHRAAMEWLNIMSYDALVEIMHTNGRLPPADARASGNARIAAPDFPTGRMTQTAAYTRKAGTADFGRTPTIMIQILYRIRRGNRASQKVFVAVIEGCESKSNRLARHVSPSCSAWSLHESCVEFSSMELMRLLAHAKAKQETQDIDTPGGLGA